MSRLLGASDMTTLTAVGGMLGGQGGGHGFAVPLVPGTAPTSEGSTNARGVSLASLTSKVSPISVLQQYLHQRRDNAREAVPPIIIGRGKSSSAAAAPEGESVDKARLFIQTDCRRAYFPGQAIEAVIALDREWYEAGDQSTAADGFADVTVTFSCIQTSYGIENVSSNKPKMEKNLLFEDVISLRNLSSAATQSTVSGMTLTPLGLAAFDSAGRVIGWHLRATFPSAVKASRMAGSKNLITKRLETRTQLLPPTFQDDREVGLGSNGIEYRLSVDARRIKKGKAPSHFAVPLLFLPVKEGSPPASDGHVPPPAYAAGQQIAGALQRTPSDDALWIESKLSSKIRRGVILDKAVINCQISMPQPHNIPVGHRVPVTVACSVSAKDRKDIEDSGSIAMPTLPLAGSLDSWPTFTIKRLEHSKAGWAEETAVKWFPCDVQWNEAHLDSSDATADRDRSHSWSAPAQDGSSSRSVRRARVSGHILSACPPPVETSALTVEYELHFTWKLTANNKLSGMLAKWIGSSGVSAEDVAGTPSADKLTRTALNDEYAVLRAFADPTLAELATTAPASSSAPSMSFGDSLPSYETLGASSSSSSSSRPQQEHPVDVKE